MAVAGVADRYGVSTGCTSRAAKGGDLACRCRIKAGCLDSANATANRHQAEHTTSRRLTARVGRADSGGVTHVFIRGVGVLAAGSGTKLGGEVEDRRADPGWIGQGIEMVASDSPCRPSQSDRAFALVRVGLAEREVRG